MEQHTLVNSGITSKTAKGVSKLDQVICRSKRTQSLSPIGYRRIDITSHAKDVFRTCSPFLCGPVALYGDYTARNVENAYQFAKVYREYADTNGNPTPAYFEWAQNGWSSTVAQRRPFGHRAPLYSFWDDDKLDLVQSRRRIYIPLYSQAVVKSDGFQELRRLYQAGNRLCLIDYDAYDHEALGYQTADDIIDDAGRTLGHCFVLKFLLEGWIPMARPFRVIIAGGRDFADYKQLKSFADRMLAGKRAQGIEVVCGDANGADKLGERYAAEHAFDIRHFPAQWDALGRRAGYTRNEQMGDYADALIAFWDGKSHGTKHMIDYMQKLNKPIRICNY